MESPPPFRGLFRRGRLTTGGRWQRIAAAYRQFGIVAAGELVLSNAVNKIVLLKQLDLMVFTGDESRPHTPGTDDRIRMATAADLQHLATDDRWQIDRIKLDNFARGDVCLLSCVDGKPVGCSWASTRDRAILSKHLSISLPPNYLYSHGAVTLPEFRGHRLQSDRHRKLFEMARSSNRQGLFCYVDHVNFQSRAAQRYTGFRRVGRLWLIGGERHLLVIPSSGARKLGVRRVHAPA